MRKASFFLACALLFVAGMATTVMLQANWEILSPTNGGSMGFNPLFCFNRIVNITTVVVILGLSAFFFFSNKENKER